MATVEEELRGTRIKERLPSIAYAKAETDRHIREMELRKQNEKLIIHPDTLNKLKGEPMTRTYRTANIPSDKDMLMLLKHCRFNSRYFSEVLNLNSQAYPAIGILAFFRACVKAGSSATVRRSILTRTMVERVIDFYNTNKGQILTPKAEDALGAFHGIHTSKQTKESKPVTIVLPKQKQTYTKLVAIAESNVDIKVFDISGKSEDFVEGIKTALSAVRDGVKFILGDEV